MSLNLAHAFVRYPEVAAAASTAAGYLAAEAKERGQGPRHILVASPGPWIGVYAEGNSTAPGLAQHLSRALEAESLWFGLAGRSLAYRVQRYKHGKRMEERTEPAGLFGSEGAGPMPLYPDAEAEVFDWLGKAGIPEAYRFLHSEELGAKSSGPADSVQIRVGPEGAEEQPFAHRAPAIAAPGIRTLFDRVNEAASMVEDDVIVRGVFDRDRAAALLGTLQKMAGRRRPPTGWSFRYVLQSPEGAALLDPITELYGSERRAGKVRFDLVRG
ncbi:MAG TPA: hypothetical protein VGK61_05590 [Planctomycetota bacterium]